MDNLFIFGCWIRTLSPISISLGLDCRRWSAYSLIFLLFYFQCLFRGWNYRRRIGRVECTGVEGFVACDHSELRRVICRWYYGALLDTGVKMRSFLSFPILFFQMGCTDCFFECSHETFDLGIRLRPIWRNFSVLEAEKISKICKSVAVEGGGGTVVRFDYFGYSFLEKITSSFGICGVEDFDFWKSAEFISYHE